MLIIPFMYWLYLLIPFFIILLYIVEELNESPGWATVLLIIILGCLQFLTPDIKPFSWLLSNPLEFIWLAVCYVVIGAFYTLGKWYLYVRKAAAAYKEWLTTNDPNKSIYYGGEVPVKVSKHKAKLLGWLTYWPLSLAGLVLNDLVREIFNAVYNMMAKTLQSISDKAFADINK